MYVHTYCISPVVQYIIMWITWYACVFVCTQDHDSLVRQREEVEKQLEHQKMASTEQKKRFEEMEVSFFKHRFTEVTPCS